MKSEFCVWYLDDGTVGGSAETVKQDLEVIKEEGALLGLELNEKKSEVICVDPVDCVQYPRCGAVRALCCFPVGLSDR